MRRRALAVAVFYTKKSFYQRFFCKNQILYNLIKKTIDFPCGVFYNKCLFGALYYFKCAMKKSAFDSGFRGAHIFLRRAGGDDRQRVAGTKNL